MAKCFLKILGDIKLKHKGDTSTCDNQNDSRNFDDLVEVYNTTEESGLRKLIATISYSFNMQMKEKNIKNAEGIINEEALGKYLSQSPLVEPNARKRRRK